MKTRAEKFDIAITGIGLNCVTGDQPFALLGAVATQLTLAKPDPVLEAPSLTGGGYDAVVTCPIRTDDEFDPETRLPALWQATLAETLEMSDISSETSKNVRLHFVVPEKASDRGSVIDAREWEADILTNQELPENSLVSVIHIESCLSTELTNACSALQNEECDILVFGVVDSLLDDFTCRELALSQRLKTVASADGMVPAEAAVFLVLQPLSAVEDSTKVHGVLRGVAIAAEPNTGKPDQKPMRGLADATRSVCRVAGIQVESAVMIRALANEQTGLLEWHHAHKQLWPERLPEDQRLAMQLGEIDAPKIENRPEREVLDVSKSVGDAGITSPLLGIALACARFEYRFPAAPYCLVVESGDFPYRATLAMAAPSSSKADPPERPAA